jgi:Na+-driven multidrug efflux pump
MFVNILMNLANAAAGRVFIFGFFIGSVMYVPALGAAGAGIAVSVARVVGTVFYGVAGARGAGRFSFGTIRLSFVSPLGSRVAAAPADREAIAAVLAIGLPAAVESLAFNGGKLLTQTYAAGLGATAVAADYLSSAAAGLIQVLLTSLSLAVPPLVGASLGRNRPEEARSVISTARFWGSVATTLMVVPGFIFAPALLGLSTDDPAVLESAVSIFRLFCCVTPFLWAPSFIVPSGMRGAGDGRFTMIVAVASMWLVRVGLGWLLAVPAAFGIMGVWIAMVADWLVRAAFFIPRFRSGAWLRRRERISLRE